MHEAILYKKLENGKVLCTACKQRCIIPQNHTGLCGVRQNREGKLYVLVYEKASAVNIDPVEKKPLFHFLPGTKIFSIGTIGCNFGCLFCQNWNISQATKDLRLRLMNEKKPELMGVEVGKYGYSLPIDKVIDICREENIPSIAYTYNEPAIFFEYAYDISRKAHANSIKNVFVSNGYESEEALQLIKPYLAAINIDLKAFTNKFYTKFCQAKLEHVLETIKRAYELGAWLEITTLIIPGLNDSDTELKNIAEFISGIDKNIPWHVTAFHPDYKMTDVPSTSYSSLVNARNIGKKSGLSYVYVGNILDEEHSSTFCPNCKTLLVRRNGYYVTIENFNNGKCSDCGEKIPGVWE